MCCNPHGFVLDNVLMATNNTSKKDTAISKAVAAVKATNDAKRALDKARVAEGRAIMAMVKLGMSASEIGRTVGRSHQHVLNVMTRNGVEPTHKGGRPPTNGSAKKATKKATKRPARKATKKATAKKAVKS